MTHIPLEAMLCSNADAPEAVESAIIKYRQGKDEKTGKAAYVESNKSQFEAEIVVSLSIYGYYPRLSCKLLHPGI